MAQPVVQPIVNNIVRSLTLCGVENDTGGLLWNGETASQRISSDVFNDSFGSCIDITFSELDDHWKTYSSSLTVAEGCIHLRPATKVNIRALVQWTRDMLRTNQDPTSTLFPVASRSDLLNPYNTHKQWLSDASDMAKSARPKNFTEKMKWLDWKTTLVNFLKSQPGRNGVPLDYVIRNDTTPAAAAAGNFLQDYSNRAPLNGNAFNHDAAKVHSYILRFISENNVAEQKILPYKDQNDERVDYNALVEFYEGVGANAKATLAAETDIQEMFYAGEKPPHMWWDEFEVRLTNAFAIVDKDAGRQVHTDEMKLRLLNKKVRADFLATMKTHIEMQMSMVPMNMTYAGALTNYRNVVNQRFPQGSIAKKTNRRVQATGTRGRGGRGRGRGSQGRTGGCGGRGGRGGTRGRRNDDWDVIGIDGRTIHVHPAYQFENEQWFNIPEDTRRQLVQMRSEYRNRKRPRESDTSTYQGQRHQPSDHPSQYQVSQVGTQYSAVPGTVYQLPPYPHAALPPPPPPRQSDISQMGTRPPIGDEMSAVTNGSRQNYQGSIMGGRNEQASLRSHNPNGRNVSNVITKRRVGRAHSVPEPAPNTVGQNEADSNADTCCLGQNFIPLHYTNCTADVYPYNDSYAPIENVPIVTGATAVDHPDGNTYILVFNEALYYGKKMKHSLINPNQVRYSGLDFYDNPARDDELFMELDDGLHLPLRYKGTKCVFSSRVPTHAELSNCTHYEMTSRDEWDPDSVDLSNIRKLAQSESRKRKRIYMVTMNGDGPSTTSVTNDEEYRYEDPTSDESILSTITPSLIQAKEMLISEVKMKQHENEVHPARWSFVSRKGHAQLSAESLSEKWYIGPKRAKATLLATTQNGARSAILPLSRRYRADRMFNIK